MSWGTNFYPEPSEFEFDSFISLHPMSEAIGYGENAEGLFYRDITPPPSFFEVPKPTRGNEHRSDGINPFGNSSSERRPSGNNPYGSRGCPSCVPCRKRKGRCKYEHPNDVCDFCKKYGHSCGQKVTKTEFAQMMSGKPVPPLRYSSVVHELEREFPQSPPDSIHEMAGKRLKEMMEKRDLVMNVVPKESPPLSSGSASPPPRPTKRRSR